MGGTVVGVSHPVALNLEGGLAVVAPTARTRVRGLPRDQALREEAAALGDDRAGTSPSGSTCRPAGSARRWPRRSRRRARDRSPSASAWLTSQQARLTGRLTES